MPASVYNPVSTYRIQFHKDFTFNDFEKIIPYLHRLGIKTIYASPVFHAVPGSMHGYDIVDHQRINPEIGTLEQLRKISSILRSLDIGWIQDIVPNHMAYHSGNAWLMDVLKKGPDSPWVSFFDISFSPTPVMAPFLGTSLEEAIEKNELNLEAQHHDFWFVYHASRFPLNESSAQVIRHSTAYKEQGIDGVNQNRALLLQLAGMQFYRLCHSKETNERINYRRFFTINQLVCVNIQHEEVFAQVHRLIKTLTDEQIFNGLRIDHIDGLHDPAQYLERLRKLVGEQVYICVEKILQQGEYVPRNWSVQGSTGYDFLSQANNVLTDSIPEKELTGFYHRVTGQESPFEKEWIDKKSYFLHHHMQGELENLHQLFITLFPEQGNEHKAALKDAIAQWLIRCPVYRYYGNRFPLKEEEETLLEALLRQIQQSDDKLEPAVQLIEQALITLPKENESYRQPARHFYQRCMQYTGVLMAKGIEDTLMYTYNRFIAHNEVGGLPDQFGISTADFHRDMQVRQEHCPLSLNATSTHDTKRGEDVRARLNVLSELPGEWMAHVTQWLRSNNTVIPDTDEQYFICQTLLGSLPMPGEPKEQYRERMQAYTEKALREAKRHTNWDSPDERYEEQVKKFVSALCDDIPPDFEAFHARIADFGIINSLAQLILKCTCPGVPDFYQGTELWDFSLVDPDNRRPVDYAERAIALQHISTYKGRESLMNQLWEHRYNAQIKLWLTQALLNERKADTELFSKGQYIPLETTGKYKDYILAFARKHKDKWLLVAIPLKLADLCQKQGKDITQIDWDDTSIALSDGIPGKYHDILLQKTFSTGENTIPLKGLFAVLPFCILRGEPHPGGRKAGILLHITSLPSLFAIGNMGPEARSFVRFLHRSGQKYWQLLPLNPVSEAYHYSPYNSYSAMAGNPLLISPELLAEQGLLSRDNLSGYMINPGDKVNFSEAEKIRTGLLHQAYQNFKTSRFTSLHEQFRIFCKAQETWLTDMAYYEILKRKHKGAPWYEWPEIYKNKDPEALRALSEEYEQELLEVKWLQYMFDLQWQELKQYSNHYNIRIIGDLPFYISYDSADVWSFRHLFALDGNGNMEGIAGVPPDYFSKEGQLWNMPTYNWEALKAEGYRWWMNRLKKNMERFDLLRIDHFRALAEYWEIPAGETTAVNGEWKKGPGADFFFTAEKALGDLPFIAEDLGDNMEKAYALRDEVMLPGMKLLQYAFAENMAQAVDIPHHHTFNSIVYTGTHDNNTSQGWYRHEMSKADKQRLEQYTGREVGMENIHRVMNMLAYASIAQTVVLPLQDVLGLDGHARMNTPGTAENNWVWRVMPEQLSKEAEDYLKSLVRLYGRE